MVGKKKYPQPLATVLGTVHDIVELLRGRPTIGDSANGKITTHLSLYGYKWEVRFTVEDIGKNRSSVTIEIVGQRSDKKKELLSMFALLDSMLLVGVDIECDENEDGQSTCHSILTVKTSSP